MIFSILATSVSMNWLSGFEKNNLTVPMPILLFSTVSCNLFSLCWKSFSGERMMQQGLIRWYNKVYENDARRIMKRKNLVACLLNYPSLKLKKNYKNEVSLGGSESSSMVTVWGN